MNSRVSLQQADTYSSLFPFTSTPGDVTVSDRETVELAVEMEPGVICLSPSPGFSGFYLTVEDAAYLDFPQSRGSTPSTPTLQRTRALSPGLQRIRARQPEVIRRARELRATLGDPIAGLAQVLQDVPVDDYAWDRIVQEPYG